MPQDLSMPALSPTMTKGKLVKWHKKEGDLVEPGDLIAEIETDKATMELESIDDGTIGKILVAEGTSDVAVGTVIAVILLDGESKDDLINHAVDATSESTPSVASATVSDKPKQDSDTKVAPQPAKQTEQNTKLKASPLAKKIASDQGIDLTKVKGSGPYGRVIKRDIANMKQNNASDSHTQDINYNTTGEDTYTEISTMRRVIADRLVESKQNAPHFYLSLDCELDNLLKARKDINSLKCVDSDEKQYNITVNDLIIKAVSLGMRDIPEINAAWLGDKIVNYHSVDVSVAVSIDGGLITPIVRNADKKPIATISSEMKQLIKRAKTGSLKPEEFQGGGFTISNMGMFGIKSFSAILNPPQSCILAVGAGIKKPVVRDNDIIETATVMSVTLSVDHRVVDGVAGARFLSRLRSYIENPLSLLAS